MLIFLSFFRVYERPIGLKVIYHDTTYNSTSWHNNLPLNQLDDDDITDDETDEREEVDKQKKVEIVYLININGINPIKHKSNCVILPDNL